MFDGRRQNPLNRLVECRGSFWGNALRLRPRMYPCFKQRFVSVDVTQTAEKGLVQEQRLNGAAVAREARMEVVEAQRERVGSQPRHHSRHLGRVLHAAKLPGVIVYQHSAV